MVGLAIESLVYRPLITTRRIILKHFIDRPIR